MPEEFPDRRSRQVLRRFPDVGDHQEQPADAGAQHDDQGAGAFGRGLCPADRKSVVQGKSVQVRVDLGGRRNINKTNEYTTYYRSATTTLSNSKHSETST